MADKPSRGLVIYGDGHASLVSSSHAHLHSLASRAVCGFLSLRAPPPSEPENEREIRELAQLLDVYDHYAATNKEPGVPGPKEIAAPTVATRFMGMRAALFSDCPSVRSFAKSLGFSVQEVPKDSAVAAELLQLLGFMEGRVLEKPEFDLVFLHVKTGEEAKGEGNVDWLDELIGEIMQIDEPGSVVASRLHFSAVLSYGAVAGNEDQCSLVAKSLKKMNSDLSLLRPRQSYTTKGGNALDDVRYHHPMLIAQWQEGVTRRDMVREFSFDEFKEHGANLAILADCFLHEVAFKLWKAPKYGA